MEAKELRKGNIVQNDVLDIFKKGFINIEARHIFEIAVKESAQGYDNYVDFFKPIPLTEEWLFKFGFQKDLNWKISLDNFYFLELMRIGEEYSAFHEKKPSEEYAHKLVRVKYVHQLQNLYFALTGEELQLQL